MRGTANPGILTLTVAATDKYLNCHAESEARCLLHTKPLFTRPYRRTLVIPAFNERIDFIDRLHEHRSARDCLLILIINRPQNSDKNTGNIALFTSLMHRSLEIFTHENICLLDFEGLNILLVDRFDSGRPIPTKQGVGCARKIGMDIACVLFYMGIVQSPWLFSSDADAHLPENYFSFSLPETGSAICFDFRHQYEDSSSGRATLRYEQAIKYYRLGLAWAKSPYAYCALGSAMAVHAHAYCAVRGFPKKAAGEDFYLLNKLAKITPVILRDDILVGLESRASDRTPFGTGAAVKNIVACEQTGTHYCYYDPRVFAYLKRWLQGVNSAVANPLEAPLISEGFLNAMDPAITAAANSLNIRSFIKHAQYHCRDRTSFMRHFHTWFDAFKTLKFLHRLQHDSFPAIPLETALSTAAQLFHAEHSDAQSTIL